MESSLEMAADAAHGAEIGNDRRTTRTFDRPDKGSRQNHLPRSDLTAIGRQAIGEPGDAARWMIEHTGGEAGLLDRAVARDDGALPAQIGIERPHRPAAQHDAG